MKKRIVLPERYQELSQEEMGTVAGGAMRCPVKGERKSENRWREFWQDILNRKK